MIVNNSKHQIQSSNDPTAESVPMPIQMKRYFQHNLDDKEHNQAHNLEVLILWDNPLQTLKLNIMQYIKVHQFS
mgnify:CR=1 FL=1